MKMARWVVHAGRKSVLAAPSTLTIMPANVVMVALDAMEPELIDKWGNAGHLPALHGFRANGVTVDMTSPVPGVRAGAWPEVNYGLSVARTGMFNVGVPQYFPREGVFRDLRQDEIPTRGLFWLEAARAGKKVAAIDQVYTAPDPASGALQLFDWGVHDRPFAAVSSPGGLVADTQKRYGAYPVQECDAIHGGSPAGYRELTEKLEQAAEVKANLLTDLLADSDWDLFAGMFSEPHCAGHQMWHLHDPPPGASAGDASDSLFRVYQAVDRGVGRVMEAAGSDALVAVVANKGMGPSVGGYQLMSEILLRMGVGAGRRLRRRVWDRVPGSAKSRMLKVLPSRVRDPLRRRAALGGETGFGAGAGALAIRNDQDSAVRLNVVGRDVAGTVAPGEAADRMLEEIRTELLNLRHTRQPDQGIVDRVEITEETLGSHKSELIPDLLVYFRQDLGLLDSCESDRVGRVEIPVAGIRTGNHTSHHRAWVVGPGVTGGSSAQAQTIDIAPTLLSRIGVPVPDTVEGRALPQLGGLPS